MRMMEKGNTKILKTIINCGIIAGSAKHALFAREGAQMRRIVAVSVTGILLFLQTAYGGSIGENTGAAQDAARSHSGGREMRILFLHHSTGETIWRGGVSDWFDRYNAEHGADYEIEERTFPKGSPYPWNNYPFDYWNIWVAHGGNEPYMEEPTLEILTRSYDVIVFKHCFPVCNIHEDTGDPDIGSAEKRIENYRLQYEALKTKMREFPETAFILWTGAARVEKVSLRSRIAALLKGRSLNADGARRAREFFTWVKEDWDEPGDNIFVWDFYELETEGGLFLKEAYAVTPTDSHPNSEFSRTVAPLLCQRIVDVIEGHGDTKGITGE
jgi:hypothetical protein